MTLHHKLTIITLVKKCVSNSLMWFTNFPKSFLLVSFLHVFLLISQVLSKIEMFDLQIYNIYMYMCIQYKFEKRSIKKYLILKCIPFCMEMALISAFMYFKSPLTTRKATVMIFNVDIKNYV